MDTSKKVRELYNSVAYSRTLLNEVKLGRGRGLKTIRDAIEANPACRKVYNRQKSIEVDSLKQKEKIMWVKDANSHLRRVESAFRDRSTYTNPMHVHQIPAVRVQMKRPQTVG